MLDIKFIRENKDKIKKNCQNREVDVDIDKLLKIDEKRIHILKQVENMRARKNKSSKEIVEIEKNSIGEKGSKLAGLKDKKEKIISQMRELDKEADNLERELKALEKNIQETLCKIPNLCFGDVPKGRDESANVVVREIGKKPKFSFKFKDYLEIAENLDLIDVKRAAKVSGTRFGYIKAQLALMEFALINMAFDVFNKQGFIPIVPPVIIKTEMMRKMGYIDTKQDMAERYFLKDNKFVLVGTSEQSIGPMHADEIFQEKDLPRRYAAFSTCFREEAGSHGKDTKGILRVHQFDKVEMFSFAKPEDSEKEHKFMLSLQEKLMKELKLPFRVVQLCAGDLARPSASTFDIETWFPSQKKYRETHSASNCTDFQARRLNIRYRKETDKKLEFVHTLNATGFAIGRTLIAIIENFQQKDGSLKIPKALQKYLNFKEIKNK